MKTSIHTIKRPPRSTFTRTFTDPDHPDLSFPVTFRRLSAMETVAALEIAQDLAVRYIDGKGEVGAPGYQPPEFLAPVDGQPVLVSRSACQVAASLQYAQVGPPEERYTFEEIVSFMTVDAICDQMTGAFCELSEREKTPDPLASTDSGPGLSRIPSGATPEAIPES